MKTTELGSDASIGLHIRKKRLELKLRQQDVASIIGVCEDSITYWENGRSCPRTAHIPLIIDFLGYTPFPYEAETFGERVKLYRLVHGLKHKEMGKILGVDGGTISNWEHGKFQPLGNTLMKFNRLLEIML